MSDKIKSIQTTLNSRYNALLVTDGNYGPATKTALIKGLQLEVGVTADGVFGPATKSKCPVLVNGSRGDTVYLLQAMMHCQGYYNGNMDSSFGPTTEQSVKSFQSKKCPPADGKAGPNTFEALCIGSSSGGGATPSVTTGWTYPLKTNKAANLNITSDFGVHRSAGVSPHIGIDIGVTTGEPLYAPFKAKVKTIFPITSSAGHAIVFQKYDNSSTIVRYLHMNKATQYSIGSTVQSGALVGYVGGSGYGELGHYGSHLHMDVNLLGKTDSLTSSQCKDPKMYYPNIRFS